MKLKFSNGESFLFSDLIEPEERLAEINYFLKTELVFDNMKMTVEEYFRYTWNDLNTVHIMDKISFYLSKMPNQRGKHDKALLSKNDEMEMNKGVRWTTKGHKKVAEKARYINFSDSSIEEKISLGLHDTDEFNSH
ncbi:hypothetical protein NSQ62_07890 [Solibacillus sp. FSL H8-0523]|uniref:hypothetical protein n=1 Tax=Solibacillus sp. FSL H8-0523 TaxID=2954511 RepID=UPI0031012A20